MPSLPYAGHTSLGYGVDWSWPQGAGAPALIGSASFYDHRFEFWESPCAAAAATVPAE